jgi:hypothetical protein
MTISVARNIFERFEESSDTFKNLNTRFITPTIASIIAKLNNKIFKFIIRAGTSGSMFGSLKYLIVESNITLFIDALSALINKKITTDKNSHARIPTKFIFFDCL